MLKKLKIGLTHDPAIPLLGIYPEKTIIEKDIWTPMFIAALFTIARTWKQPKCPSTDVMVFWENPFPLSTSLCAKHQGFKSEKLTQRRKEKHISRVTYYLMYTYVHMCFNVYIIYLCYKILTLCSPINYYKAWWHKVLWKQGIKRKSEVTNNILHWCSCLALEVLLLLIQ